MKITETISQAEPPTKEPAGPGVDLSGDFERRRGRRNVFVLCTGRSGSRSFAKACQQITNYSSAHESRVACLGEHRLAYPPQHIEVDNRLAWFLGRLEFQYGDTAHYVHLQRDPLAVAHSFVRRWDRGIVKAYRDGIHFDLPEPRDKLAACLDLVATVTANIEAFLKSKTKKTVVRVEYFVEDFSKFWSQIDAVGDLQKATSELASPSADNDRGFDVADRD